MAVGHLHASEIDAYAGLDSPIHRWDGRFKIVGLLGLIIAFASIQSIQSLPFLIIITFLIFGLSRLPWQLLKQRLIIPGVVVAALVIFLPFISGETAVFTLGPITIFQEGLFSAFLIAGRLFCIVTVALVMFGTDTFIRTIRALRALHFPDIMADMVLLTYRYLFEISAFFGQMQIAARLRGFQGNTFSLNNIGTLASLIGHLFIRSYEKSERVYKAMVLRGYGVGVVRQDIFNAVAADYLKTAVCLITATLLLLGERVL